MTDTAFDHPLPWTEPEYFELAVTTSRVELIDGCLILGPNGGNTHNDICDRLGDGLGESARAVGLHVHRGINLRLDRGRVTNPDLVVDDGDWGTRFTWASEIVMVGEVVSESTALTDRVLKRRLYAEAGIGWYLLVEPRLPESAVALHLLRLSGDHYVEHRSAEAGEILKSGEPFSFELHTADLLDIAS